MAYPNIVTTALVATLSTICLADAVCAAEKSLDIGIVTARTGPLAAPGKFQLNGFSARGRYVEQSGRRHDW